MTTELMPKRLEILKELVPSTRRVTLLQDPEAATNAFELTQEVAKRLGVQLQAAQVTAAKDLASELAAIAKDRPDGLLVYPDMVLSSHPRPRDQQQDRQDARHHRAADAAGPRRRGDRISPVNSAVSTNSSNRPCKA
jgi:hypothetical protein